jgi:hypothetical protein
MLLLVVQFVVCDINDYFALVAFQMAQLTLYVDSHVVLSVGNYNVHVQISTCID